MRGFFMLYLRLFTVSSLYFAMTGGLFGMEPEQPLVKSKIGSSQDILLNELKKITGKTIDQKVREINSLPKETQDAFKNQERWAKPISIALESFQAPEYGAPNLTVSPQENCVAFTNKAVYLCNLLEKKELSQAEILFEDKDLINPLVAFSPDGKLLAVGFERPGTPKGEVTVWDVGTKEQKGKRNFDYSITALNWTPQGHIAIGFDNLKVLICDAPLLSLRQELDLKKFTSGWGAQFISSIAFSSDGAYLAVTLYDREGVTHLYEWDADANLWQLEKILKTYEKFAGMGADDERGFSPTVSQISPDKKYLAVGCHNEHDTTARVRIFNLVTGECVKVLEDIHKGRIIDLSYSPINNCLAAVANKVLTIFDTDKRIPLSTLFDEGHNFDKAIFTPSGNCLASITSYNPWAEEHKSTKHINFVIFACGSLEEMLCKQALINAQENKSIEEIKHLLSSNTWRNLPNGLLKTALYTKAQQLMKPKKASAGALARIVANSMNNKYAVIATGAVFVGLCWFIRNSSKKE